MLDDKALDKAGYGGVVGVGRLGPTAAVGRLVHKGGKKQAKKVALVSKGIVRHRRYLHQPAPACTT